MNKEIIELTEKIDKILEMQVLILSKLSQDIIAFNEPILKSSITKKLSKKENEKLLIEKTKEQIQLKFLQGSILQKQFNLVAKPSVERIKAYLRTKDESAFDGLKRNK